ncbi:MAG TPA: ABC transporter substrate-binding protein [Clostridiaceae bacterium]|nr:ABC transporter substrate-binding protein [Clostridiaceae bacterium]
MNLKIIAATLMVGLILAFTNVGCTGSKTNKNQEIEDTQKTENNQSIDNNTEDKGKEQLQDVKVLLDWVPNTNHTGLYVALKNGYYEEEGLNVSIIQPPEGGSAELVAAGQADFGIGYQEQVTYARTTKNPLPVKAVAAIIQHNTSGFASPVEKNIKTPKDFEGKKYGGWGSPMEDAMLKGVMEKYNADFNKLTIVNIGMADFFTSVQRDVDFCWIYYGWDGIAAELKGIPLNFIKLQDVDPELDFYTPLIMTSESLIEKDPEMIRKFLRATAKGYKYAIEKPEEAAEILLEYAPEIDRQLAIESQKYLAKEYIADAKRWGEMKKEVWETYGNWMYKNGLLESELDAEEAFANEFLPE